jgi:ADP-heptose:LPS heptosyltransferase
MAGSKYRFAVVQLLRFGDLIQTYQSCRFFKNNFPEVSLTLICRKSFGHPLRFLLDQIFDTVYYIDLKDSLHAKHRLSEALSALKTQVSKINEQNYDVCLNFSFSPSSEYLCQLIKSEHKIGPHRNDQNKLQINDLWGKHVYSNIMTSSHNSFHLVDIFRYMLGDSNLAVMAMPTRKGNRIIIHPFSSQLKKRFSAQSWATLINEVHSGFSDIKITIVGSASEVDESQKIVNFLSPKAKNSVENKTGETSFEQLFHLFDDAALFIGHDSMVGHMASLQQIQTITVFLGPVRPAETIPYGNLNYGLIPEISCYPCQLKTECSDLPCHTQVSLSELKDFVFEILETGVASNQYSKNSYIVSHLNDQLGLKIELVENISKGETNYTTFVKLFDILWTFVYRNLEIERPIGKVGTNVHELLKVETKHLETIYELAGFGTKYAKFLSVALDKDQPDSEQCSDFLQKITEINNLIQSVTDKSVLTRPIVNKFFLELGLYEFHDPRANVGLFLESYQSLSLEIQVLYELIQTFVSNQLVQFDGTNKEKGRNP